VVFVAWRVENLDPEEQPLRPRLGPQIIFYWPWLLWQIVLANLDVAKRILDPKLPISPTMITLKPTQRSEMGQVIYANSITLTPGTVTTALSEGQPGSPCSDPEGLMTCWMVIWIGESLRLERRNT
jgi:multicomponent Na+:H+ antiporter subunit E